MVFPNSSIDSGGKTRRTVEQEGSRRARMTRRAASEAEMTRTLRALAAGWYRPAARAWNGVKAIARGPLLLATALAPVALIPAPLTPAALAQQAGGTLHLGHFTSPASMSMLEESTVAVNRPMMGVVNNLVMFKQIQLQNTPDSIVPEL